MPDRSARAPEVRVFAAPEAALQPALAELQRLANGPVPALVSFATGGTFTALLQLLHKEILAGCLRTEKLLGTHLDEYLGLHQQHRGGMLHELLTECPSLGSLLRGGAFVPVPSDGAPAALAAHTAHLQRLGGVALQFLGIGRNGHLAFNEPGTPFELGFHVTALAAATREDARPRFAPAEVPSQAVTAGIASILAARRLVLCAFGKSKAPAVRAMLQGEVSPQCPASAIRLHGNALVLLDREAASGLDAASASAMG